MPDDENAIIENDPFQQMLDDADGGVDINVDYDPDNEDLIKRSREENLKKSVRQSVKAVILNEYNEVLILKDSMSPYWDLPGGGVDLGETPEVALVREVGEELSVAVHLQKMLFSTYLTLTNGVNQVTFYHAKLLSEHITLSHEHTRARYVQIEELHTYDMGAYAELMTDLCRATGVTIDPLFDHFDQLAMKAQQPALSATVGNAATYLHKELLLSIQKELKEDTPNVRKSIEEWLYNVSENKNAVLPVFESWLSLMMPTSEVSDSAASIFTAKAFDEMLPYLSRIGDSLISYAQDNSGYENFEDRVRDEAFAKGDIIFDLLTATVKEISK